ncbi:concanavalin A-like lectin/glucanase domain-containing protein [Thermoascus aurantiacus ATCC 26904]
MPSFTKFAAAALAASLPFASAQTYTSCDPTKSTSCPPDPGLDASTYHIDFRGASSPFQGWNTVAGTVNTGDSGAEFTIQKQGDAPTIETAFYFLFGRVDVTMKVAPGTGIVSSIVLESDDLDEIDWEALGGDTTQVQTNYFGKGDTSSYDRATFVNVNSPQTTFHTYSVDWTSSAINWLIDGNVVRTLNYADAQGGSRFPQTPARLRLGIWAGGDPSNPQGTIEWAGGVTDYSQAPFTMYVQSVDITNYTPASEYQYTDTSGSWQSIKAINGTTTQSTMSGTTTTTTTTVRSTIGDSSSSSTATAKTGTTTGTGSSTATGTGTSAPSSTASSSSSSSPSSGSASSSSPSSTGTTGSSAGGASESASASSSAVSSTSTSASASIAPESLSGGAGSTVRASFGLGPLLALCVFVAAAIAHV